jgi:hypothetical protein
VIGLIGISITITLEHSDITAYNRWLPKTRSIPSWPTSVFSSSVTDLHEWRLSSEFFLRMNYVSYYNWVRTGNWTLPWPVRLLYSAYVNTAATTRCHGYVLSEAPPSNGPLRLSGFLTHSLSCKRASTRQQQCVNKSLPSNGCPFLLHYSAFSRHVTIYLPMYISAAQLSLPIKKR